jgi:hypothetical protein
MFTAVELFAVYGGATGRISEPYIVALMVKNPVSPTHPGSFVTRL